MTDYSHLPDRALSIRQPWAWAILHAGKDIENRKQKFKQRGPICIHASQNNDYGKFLEALQQIHAAYPGRTTNYNDKLPRGGIIATAEIVDCVQTSDSPWFMGPNGLILKNVQPIPFIQVKGALGFFKWKDRL